MKTITRPTGTIITSRNTTTAEPRIVSKDVDRHLYWIERNTIWQGYMDRERNGMPCVVITTPFSLEYAINMMIGTDLPMSVRENDMDYNKNAAYAELSELLATAMYEDFDIKGCGTWTRIVIPNAKFYWDK